MLHIRVITPSELTETVTGVCAESVAVTNVVVLPGVAREPAGDLVQFDLAREAADAMLSRLRDLGIDRTGSISVENVDVSISAAATTAEEAAPGYDDDAVVWDELDARTAADARLSWAFLAFLALATQIAAIGALLDQPILIVGAMVLGPEFGAVAAICFGVVRRDRLRIVLATRTLVVGFLAAIAVTTACAAVSRWPLGWIQPSMLDDRPLTDFIVHPDRWSFVVAVLAGIAGILSITAAKSSALVGVFISVTTVPAAGNIAVAIPLGHWGEVGSSAVQLGVNLAGMFVAGVATLAVQRVLSQRYGVQMPLPRTQQRRARLGRGPRRVVRPRRRT
ncbi:DUF389 domain-containing protein [Actinocatenispora rupis]|uniref:TIGR00341 family protein n=1 Tax=Actinocatenispora rupis TaxID=519421 RepID=A0A8J3NGE4_9ACTN|nr:DUF389 domain-containing protein [Actinocatenispora rupis]GID15845.1 hypothetical protein Aru02nite_67340 [Actinocatenispora rupis]